MQMISKAKIYMIAWIREFISPGQSSGPGLLRIASTTLEPRSPGPEVKIASMKRP
jgi:hypothetical protein